MICVNRGVNPLLFYMAQIAKFLSGLIRLKNAMDDNYAQQRVRNVSLLELTQIKGTSETHPMLSDNHEWAGFEYDVVWKAPHQSGRTCAICSAFT